LLVAAATADRARSSRRTPAAPSFGDYLLARARADLGKPNVYGPPGVPYCALAVQRWIRDAARDAGLALPIPGSASAKTTMEQFRTARVAAWIEASALRADPSLVRPGMVAVWTRGDPSAPTGHIGVVETEADADGTFGTIEANHTPVVARFRSDLRAESLLGMGLFKPAAMQELVA
jgi:hypothetical protein